MVDTIHIIDLMHLVLMKGLDDRLSNEERLLPAACKKQD